MAEKKCFIIMPITTPEDKLSLYQNDKQHFDHVLECLFKPSIKKAGFKPIGPISKGSNVIHADIIKKLDKSDLVLCDMSCLNPNVFFEFGIRTSLNKPVSVVVDDVTDPIPFDTAIINREEYSSALETWNIEKSITILSEHIKKCYDENNIENPLWKYFSLTSTAEISKSKDEASKTELIEIQLESILKKMDYLLEDPRIKRFEEIKEKNDKQMINYIVSTLANYKIGTSRFKILKNNHILHFR